MIISKTKQLNCSNAFHYFAYQEYEISSEMKVEEAFLAFLKSPHFTYSNNHRVHCCGPFDNSKLDIAHFRIIKSENIYKNCGIFFAEVKHYLDFMPNSNFEAIEFDKTQIDKQIEASFSIIRANIPKSSSLFTIGYYKKYEDDKMRVEANAGLTRLSLHDYASVFEYYKILIGINERLIQVYYFLWD
jgi:hypothetical protein